MSLLLDTNVVSELRKGERTHPRVRAWFESVADADLHLSVLVVGELRRGIERVRAKDGKQATALEPLASAPDARARRPDSPHRSARGGGRFSAERNGSAVDVLMAATAFVHELVLVTRNTHDVAWTGVACMNPFESRE